MTTGLGQNIIMIGHNKNNWVSDKLGDKLVEINGLSIHVETKKWW